MKKVDQPVRLPLFQESDPGAHELRARGLWARELRAGESGFVMARELSWLVSSELVDRGS